MIFIIIYMSSIGPTLEQFKELLNPDTRKHNITVRCNKELVKLCICNFNTIVEKLDLKDQSTITILRNTLNFMKTRRKHDGYSVVFSTCRKSDDNAGGYGRLFPDDGYSYVSMHRPVRKFIASGIYSDHDIVNCHPVIISQLLNTFNIRNIDGLNASSLFAQWNDKREEYFKLISECSVLDPKPNRDDAKRLAYCFLYNGSVDKRFRELGIDKNDPRLKEVFTLTKRLGTATTFLSKTIKENYPKTWDKLSYNKSKGDSRKDTGKFSSLMQHIERAIMLTCASVAKKFGYEIGDYCHDGLFLCNSNGTPVENCQDFYDKCQTTVKEKYGFEIKIIEKPMESPEMAWLSDLCHRIMHKIPEFSEKQVFSDKQAAECFIKHHIDKDVLMSNGGYELCYDSDARIWMVDEVKNLMYKSEIKMYRGDKGFVPMENAGEIANMFSAYNDLKVSLPRRDYFSVINNRTIGRLYFLDGWFDMITGETGLIDGPETAPLCCIPRQMPDWTQYSLEHPDVVAVRTHITTAVLGDLEPLVLGIFGRASAGFIRDKVWYNMPGERNSGKGVLSELLQIALGKIAGAGNNGYVTTTAMPMVKSLQGDAKSKSFFISSKMYLARVAIINELAGSGKLDGNLIKSLTSGGDLIEARINHKDEQYFANNSTIFMFYNPTALAGHNILPVEPADALKTCYCIPFPYVFTSKAELSKSCRHRLEDKEIKSKIINNSESWGNAFLWLLHYYMLTEPITRSEYVNKHGRFKMPSEIVGEYDDIEEITSTPLHKFNKHFAITDDDNDFTTSQDIADIIGISTNKVKNFLDVNFGKDTFTTIRKQINGLKYRGFMRIARVCSDDDQSPDAPMFTSTNPDPEPGSNPEPVPNIAKMLNAKPVNGTKRPSTRPYPQASRDKHLLWGSLGLDLTPE